MLVVTLPTIVDSKDILLAQHILENPLVLAARYNTGGDSPFSPQQLVGKLRKLQDRFMKPIYIDLDGRQLRVAEWSALRSRCAVLNRSIQLTLPGKIHFRHFGWHEIVAQSPSERKVFFSAPEANSERLYLGASQTAHIVAKDLLVTGGYLNDRDKEFVSATARVGLNRFMLSFFEQQEDIAEFYNFYSQELGVGGARTPELILKIESEKGLRTIASPDFLLKKGVRLMAARDDLYLSFVQHPQDFLRAVRTIVQKDPEAIVASRIMAGIEAGQGLAPADLADLVLLQQFGYRHFMWSDELAQKFETSIRNWHDIVLPLLTE